MPRKLRVEYEGAIYVMNRGDQDRNFFMDILDEACRKADESLR